jgi:hypothetical protein
MSKHTTFAAAKPNVSCTATSIPAMLQLVLLQHTWVNAACWLVVGCGTSCGAVSIMVGFKRYSALNLPSAVAMLVQQHWQL